jgi:hypothetical protein
VSVQRRASIRSWIARLLVAAGHVIVLLLILTDRPRPPGAADARWPERLSLRLIEAPPVRQPPNTVPTGLRRIAPAAAVLPLQAAVPQPAAAGAISPHIDWEREAERAGKSGAALLPPKSRNCEDTRAPGSMLPRCRDSGRPFEWNPEHGTVEWSGGLPFVHVGKTCVIGLGFFACGIGGPPPANGHLFDQLHDPDRVTDSVADAGH